MNGVLILGAGGHAKVVADTCLCLRVPVLGFLDDNPAAWRTQVLGLPVLGALDTWARHDPEGLVLAIGSNRLRQQIDVRLGARAQALWWSVVHPRATIAASAAIGAGGMVMAGAVVNAEARIGRHAILNTGATVDHDCWLGDFVHVAPGAHLAGGVRVGEGTLIGIGAVVNPGCVIGAWCTIGAGAVVVNDIADGTVAKGVPARG